MLGATKVRVHLEDHDCVSVSIREAARRRRDPSKELREYSPQS